MAGPQVGQVVDGFRFLGGDPNQAGSWGPAGMADSPEDQKSLVTARDDASKALNVAQQAERFMALNRQQATGPAVGFLNLGGMAGDKAAQMDAITSAVAPGLRPPGSGSSSDRDVAMYRKGFPNVETYGTANEVTAQRLHDQAVQESAKSAYLDSWFQHRGTLLGAEPAFNAYWSKRQSGYGQVAPGTAPQAAPMDLSKMSDAEVKAKLGIQ